MSEHMHVYRMLSMQVSEVQCATALLRVRFAWRAQRLWTNNPQDSSFYMLRVILRLS